MQNSRNWLLFVYLCRVLLYSWHTHENVDDVICKTNKYLIGPEKLCLACVCRRRHKNEDSLADRLYQKSKYSLFIPWRWRDVTNARKTKIRLYLFREWL